MRLSWQLVLSYLLVGGVALLMGHLYAGKDSLPVLLTRGLLVSLFIGLGMSRLLLGPLHSLREKLRQLAGSGPEEEEWSQELGLPQLPDLEVVLDDFRERTRLRVEQLTMERSRLEGILESITEGIMVTGRDGRVVMANSALCQLFGIRESLQGRLPVEVVRNNQVEEAISRSLGEGKATSTEVTLRGSGECFLDVHIAPVKREEECIGAVSVFYNITKLRQLERVRKDFVANVSHELRTPLTAIKGYAETLADGALDDRKAAERFVQIISSHADRLNRLLDDILDLSRLEAENTEVEFERCRMHKIADNCISSVVQTASRKEINIDLEVPEDLQVMCDAKLIEQAVLNLLDNAVKYTPDGGEVRLRAREEEDQGGEGRVVVEVSDTGIGIPSKDLERIFERFFRVDKGRSRAMGGTGLGLSIVRHIIQAHGEKVWVESDPSKGTTFVFTLKTA
ncbi:MAG: PAS domain S-box protein [Gemmatimonadetes bacterium]|jgi:two-component system, OmpR family, phosphate regulon sensor histidine kinase PhoR|nr:PAS domain S-box protein [Gemmatimonadota bacterium]